MIHANPTIDENIQKFFLWTDIKAAKEEGETANIGRKTRRCVAEIYFITRRKET